MGRFRNRNCINTCGLIWYPTLSIPTNPNSWDRARSSLRDLSSYRNQTNHHEWPACVRSQAYTGKAHTQGFWLSLQTHTRCCGSSTGAYLPCSASLSVPCLSQLLWSSRVISANKSLFSWGYSSRMLWVFCSTISDDFRVTTAKMPRASVQLLCWFRKKALNRVTLALFLDSYLKRYHATPQPSPRKDEGKGLSHY